MKDISSIIHPLLAWWDTNHLDLPWHKTNDPYAIWVSEIMLQQTQIATVLPYYKRWMQQLPTIQTLAAAPLADVLKLWEGLGYYRRARNLHSTARMVVDEYNGEIPKTLAELLQLKGIGRYTAGAIASIAFNQQVPVVDGNVIRVLSRLTNLPDDVTKSTTIKALWQLASTLVPADRPGDYNQALMELGQQICISTRPRCDLCPIREGCLARQQGTQLERPVRPPRKRIPHYDVTAGIIWQTEEQTATAKFLIAQRPLQGLLGGLWEFPGGKQEPGESLPDTLKREIAEELAIEIEVGSHLISIKHAYTHFKITLHAFQAHFISGDIQHLGVANHAWITLAEVDDYAFAITDHKIIAALRQILGYNSTVP